LKADAVRFMGGMPNFPGIYALKTGVDFLLQVGVENIDRGLRPLVARLRQGLADRGLELLTPPDPELASGIVSVATPNAREAGSLLDERGIHTWYGDGRVRASVHLYNDEEDIERYLAVLPEVLAPQDVTHG
jgi:selenocysteine lyase/cysteine desulfurase